jgi:P27 family predicted phage terminase small subunit
VGERGPAPAPTNLRILRGDRKDRVNQNEPKPNTDVDIVAPSWLTQRAKNVWKRYAPDLQRTGVLTAWDVEAFAIWCDSVVRRRDAVDELRKGGSVIELPVYNKNGELTGTRMAKSPWTLVLREADGMVMRYGARFGLTPSDRAQLHMGEAPRDPKGDLLGHG